MTTRIATRGGWVLLRRLGEDGREQRLLVVPRRRHVGGPVGPVGGLADGVGVREQRLPFIGVLGTNQTEASLIVQCWSSV